MGSEVACTLFSVGKERIVQLFYRMGLVKQHNNNIVVLSFFPDGCLILGEVARGEVAVGFCWRTIFLLSSLEKQRKWWILWATETQLIKILRAFVKVIGTWHGIWHWGSHMLLGRLFSGGKCLEAIVQLHTEGWGFTDVEYANNCFAVPAEAVLSANQAPTPLLCHWEPTHWKSGPLPTRIVELFTIFTHHLRSCVEHKRKKRRGEKRKHLQAGI